MALGLMVENVESLSHKFERWRKDLKINMEEHVVCRKLFREKSYQKQLGDAIFFFYYCHLG